MELLTGCGAAAAPMHAGQFRQTMGKPKTLSHAGDFFGLFAVDTSPDDRWMVRAQRGAAGLILDDAQQDA